MAWTTPRTWVAGEIVRAATMNEHVRDNLAALRDESLTKADNLAALSDKAAARENLGADTNYAPRHSLGVVTPPTDFSFATLPLPTVRRRRGGEFYADIDTSTILPNAGKVYYVAPAGSGAADGLSPATPTTIPAALGKADVGMIVCAPGEYFRDLHALSGAITNKHIRWVASGEGVKITGWNDPTSQTWALVSGSIYSTARSVCEQIVDVYNLTSWGDYTRYTEMGTTSGEITGEGQWATDGTTVWVWPIGSPDMTLAENRKQIRLGLGSAVRTGLDVSGGRHYVQGITFEGSGTGGLYFTGGSYAVLEDVVSKYHLQNGVAQNDGFIVCRRVETSSNLLDGFSYHEGTSTEFIEDDCHSHHNGLVTPGQNNGSTAHETVRGLRVGGLYEECGGPIIADVNSSRTWNVGVAAGRSTIADGQSWRVDSSGFTADPARQWLDQCEAFGSPYAYAATGTGSAIYTHLVDASGDTALLLPASVGTVTEYDA